MCHTPSWLLMITCFSLVDYWIIDAFAHSGQILEGATISSFEMEWTGLIDSENYLIEIKGMKAGSNDAFYYKIEHRMVICEQPPFCL